MSRRSAGALVAIAAVATIGLAFIKAAEPTNAAIDALVRAAILSPMTIVELPTGNAPGHVSDQALAEVHDRIDTILPTVYLGDLLSTVRDRLSGAIDELAAIETLGENTDAGITSLTVWHWPVFGWHADVHGSFSVWLTGRHWDGGQLVDDRSEGSYRYSAGLDMVGGRWLVTSWSDQPVN